MRHTIEIMESSLKNWEDMAFLLGCLQSVDPRYAEALGTFGRFDILRNASGLRDHLMLAQTAEEAFDKPRFLGTERIPELIDLHLMLPYMLWQWSRHSRRAFHLDGDLQALLRHTVVQPDLLATGIPLPFPSFLLLFSEPIHGSVYVQKAAQTYRAMLVFPVSGEDSHDGRDYVGFMLLADAWRDYRPLGPYDREKVRKSMAKAPRRMTEPLKEALRRTVSPYTEFCTFTPDGLARHALATTEDFHQRSVVPEIARLIIGFSLYLSMLPSGGGHRSDWKAPPKPDRPDPRAITHTAEICEVASMHRLTAEERQHLFSESVTTGRELSAHFRRGHFRKAPGKGADPTAPKTIWVTPTLVRRDRLKPGELAGGALALVE